MALNTNEGRNMNEVVDFYNGSEFPLEMIVGTDNFGVVKAKNTVKVPRYVAEFWAQRNLHYKLIEHSPVAEMIETDKAEIAGVEEVYNTQHDVTPEPPRRKDRGGEAVTLDDPSATPELTDEGNG